MRNNNTTKKIVLILTFLFFLIDINAQTENVGIGTTTPDNSSILELLSNSKGLLIPRMTTIERDAIVTPATSLIIYNTTNSQFEYNEGTPASPSWIAFAASSGLSDVYGSGADGQVTYWNSSSTLTGSNDLFWDYTNDRLGIGNNTPRERLDLQGLGGIGALIVGDASSSYTGTIRWSGSDFEGYDGTDWVSFTASSTINGSGTAGQVTYWSGAGLLSGNDDLFWDATNSILGIGTNTPSSTVTLHVAGNGLFDNNLEIVGEISGKALLLNPQSATPTAVEGNIYYNNSDNKVKVYDGSSWKNIGGIWEESGADAYRSSGNVAVGRSSPRERLDLQDLSGDGALIVGNTSTSYTGAIKWDGFDFYGYNGSDWLSFTTGGGGGGGSSTITGNGYAGQVTVWSSTATLTGSNNLFWNNVGIRLGIGDNTPDHTLDIAGNLGLDPDSYINFNDVDGTTGYGFRDNGGVIEFKNDGGSWSNFSALSGGDVFGAGNGTVGQVAWWTSSSTITGVANLFWDNSNIRLGVGDNTPDHMLDVGGNIGLNTSAYINFGDVDGSTGYGFRDNAGVIEFKNGGGGWQNFSALSGGDVYGGGTGAAGEVAFWTTSSTITGSSNLFWDNTNSTLSVGSDGNDGIFRLYSEQGGTDYEIIFQPNPVMTESTTYTFPSDLGSSGQVLTTDGNGLLDWTTVSGGGGGGNVYGNGSNGQVAFWNSSSTITGVNNLFWNDTQNRLDVVGTLQVGKNGTGGALRLFSEQGATDYDVMFIPNSSMTESTTYTLPPDLGSSGQVLTTDGNGLLDWTTVSGGGGGGNVYGNGSNGQIAFWNSSSTITGVNNLFWNDSQSRLEVVGTIQSGKNGTDGSFSLFSEQGGIDYNVMFIPDAAMTESTTYTLPTDYGTVGQVLSTDGSGDLSWINMASGGNVSGTGTVGQVAYWLNSSTLTGDNGLFFDDGYIRLGIGDNTPDHGLDVAGNIGLDAGGFINFGDTDGAGGYGLWDDAGIIKYRNNGGSWTTFPTGNTLDQAYDQGGAGVGKFIAVDAGTVGLYGSNSGTYTLAITNTANGGVLRIDNGGTGNSIIVNESSGISPFSLKGTGRVGIGTANPSAMLDIVPSTSDAIIINPDATSTPTNLKFMDADASAYVGVASPGAVTASVIWTLPAADGAAGEVLSTDGSGVLSWTTAGGVTLNGAYDFGGAGAGRIITVDNGAVDLQGSNAADYTLRASTSANGGLLFLDNNGTGASFRVESGATPNLFVIDETGSVGIGTATPDALLHLVGPSGSNGLHIATGEIDGTDYLLHLEDTDANVQAMYVDVSGNIGLGTITPTAKLEITPATGTDAIIINPDATATPTNLKFMDADASAYVGFAAPGAVTTSIIWILPTSDGTNGQALVTDGAGNLGWASGGAGSPNGPDGSVQYNDGGSFNGEAELVWSETNNELDVGGAVLRQGFFMAYLTANQGENGAGIDAVDWSGEIREDASYYSHAANDDDIQILQYGWYRVSYAITVDNTQGAGSTDNAYRMYVTYNGTAINGSSATCWTTQAGEPQDRATSSNSFIFNIPSGQQGNYLRVYCVDNEDGDDDNYDFRINSQVTIERIDQ